MNSREFARTLLSLPHGYWNGFPPRFKRLEVLADGKMPALERASIHLTDRCNLRCKYCSGSGAGEINNETTEKLLEAFASLGAKYLDISGGEVTLLGHELERTVRLAADMGFKVVLSSNGVFNPARRNGLISSGISMMNISLDSADPEINDRICGVPGAWAAASNNISALSSSGVETFIHTMVTSENHYDLPERLLRFKSEFPCVRDVQVIPPRNSPRYQLSMSQITAYYESLERIDASVSTRYPMAAMKIPALFGSDSASMARASKGIYRFEEETPCYVTMQELKATPRGMYSCGYLFREGQEAQTTLEKFIQNPKGEFSRIQKRILSRVPFCGRCKTACSPEMSSLNISMRHRLISSDDQSGDAGSSERCAT